MRFVHENGMCTYWQLFKIFSAMKILGVLFTVILLFVPSRALSRVDDESFDHHNRDLSYLSSRAAVERVPLQFER